MHWLIAMAAAAAGAWSWHDLGQGRMELRDAWGTALVYNYGPQLAAGAPAEKRRCCYVHPLSTPAGTVVTDDFPKDHWHHRGVFWAWPIVKAGGKQYDGWLLRSGIENRFVKWISRGDAGVLAVENGWYVGGRQIMRETVRIQPAAVQAANERRIQFTLTFEALEPVELSGAPEEEKGYGGFSVRFAPRTGTNIVSDSGGKMQDSNMEPHPWVAMTADYSGKHATVVVGDDSANPGFPNGWCIRNYGFLGVNYPGRKTLRLEPGKPLTLKYTVATRDDLLTPLH